MAALDPQSVQLHRSGSGPPLVLLHCLGVDHRFWDFALPLASEFTLLRYDLPGHGATAVPSESYRIEDLSDQLAAVLAAHGIARPRMAGISLGGLIAQHFAANEVVDRLVLIDTTPRYTEEMRATWAERAATARTRGAAALVEDLLKVWFSADFLAQDPPAVRYVRSTLGRTSGEGYALACEALAAADLRNGATKIRAPTLVICGDDDLPSFRDAAEWLAGSIESAKLAWIGGARHASVLEQPDRACTLLRGFLASA
jgi:3-oxoadipate enol-lactonase